MDFKWNLVEIQLQKDCKFRKKVKKPQMCEMLHAILNNFGPIVKTMQDHAATLRIDSLEYAKKLTIKPDYVIENNS